MSMTCILPEEVKLLAALRRFYKHSEQAPMAHHAQVPVKQQAQIESILPPKHPPPSTCSRHLSIFSTCNHPPLLQKPRLDLPRSIFPWRRTPASECIPCVQILDEVILIKYLGLHRSQSQQLFSKFLERQAINVKVVIVPSLAFASDKIWCARKLSHLDV